MQSGSIYSGIKVRRGVSAYHGQTMYIIDSISRRLLIDLLEQDHSYRYISNYPDWTTILQRDIDRTLSRHFWKDHDSELSRWLHQNSAQVTFGIDVTSALSLPWGRRDDPMRWGISFGPHDPLESFFALTFL